jgi:hypothetical protein
VEAYPNAGSFDGFMARFPMLLDKSLPFKHWQRETLLADDARAGLGSTGPRADAGVNSLDRSTITGLAKGRRPRPLVALLLLQVPVVGARPATKVTYSPDPCSS